MANQCSFCGIRHIETNMLVLNGGELWVEFCAPCGGENVLTNGETGEQLLVRELFDRCQATHEGRTFERKPEDITIVSMIIARQEQQEQAEHEYDQDYADYCEELDRQAIEMYEEQKQLQIDHWDNLEYKCQTGRKNRCPNFMLTQSA